MVRGSTNTTMKGNERVVVILLSVLVCIGLAGAINLDIVSTQKPQYYTDETVILSLYTLENVNVHINSNTTSYRYLGFAGNTLQFNPKELGQHMIIVKNQSNDAVIGNSSFIVNPEIVVGSDSKIVSEEYLHFEKDQYLLGDVVRISISNIEQYTLFIQSNESIYKFLGSPDTSLKFSPKKLGNYVILLEHEYNIIASKNFSVLLEQISSIPTQPPHNEELFMIFDSENVDRRKHVLASKQDNQIILETENLIVKKIKFNNLNVSDEFHLGIEDVPQQKIRINKKPVSQSYAIDPSQLEFTTAMATITAKGTELYKCKDWNFSTQTCYGTWIKIMDITPGENYNITFFVHKPTTSMSSELTILSLVCDSQTRERKSITMDF